MEIYAVRINGYENPIGFDLKPLICSWKVRDSMGSHMIWGKIKVALDEAMNTVIYEKTGSDLKSVGELLEMELLPYTRYYYQITVASNVGDVAESEICFFETGKLQEPWIGKWIGVQEDIHPEFKKEFLISEKIRRARLYISGLGLFEAYINGNKAGDDLLAPFNNDYEAHVQYCTYDVTDLLKAENEITVFLGNGWYRGRYGLEGEAHPNRPMGLIAELRIEYEDGRIETIVTDETWQYRASYFERTDIYDGEIQNHLKYREENAPWKQANPVSIPMPLCERYSLPLCEMEELSVKDIIHTPAGEMVLDFGQNFAGYVEYRGLLSQDVTLKLEFGEILQNGNFYHDNYRTAESVFIYISDGKQRKIRPHFTFYGFRYVKVSGLECVKMSDFIGRAVYSKMEQIGFIHTGNDKINQLFSNSLWSLKSNFLDMPTDCPQRDERLGWTGDAQVFCPTACCHMDVKAFYQKFLKDLRTDQLRNDGKVAVYLPNNKGMMAGVWSDAATFIPWTLYQYYGDKEILAANYDLMKDWVDCVRRADEARGRQNLYNFGFQFGDWLALDGATEQSFIGRTDSGYICSMYYYASACYVASSAKILGKEEATEYNKLAEEIKKAILEEYFTTTGRLAVNTQTGYLVALRFQVYKDKQRMIDGLKNCIKYDNNKIKGGFVGATMMNTVLADNEMADIAYDFLFYEGFPGWLYAVNLGATTIWERWNSVLEDGTISGTGMNSLNHYSYGSVMEFLYRHSAGIKPIQPGFQKAEIAPKIDRRLGFMECSFDSANGKYVSNWHMEENGEVHFYIEIPFGCEAEVRLPKQETKHLIAGKYNFSCQILQEEERETTCQ